MVYPVGGKTQGQEGQNSAVCPFVSEKLSVVEIVKSKQRNGPEHSVHTEGGVKVAPEERQPRPGHTAAGAGEVQEMHNGAWDLQQKIHTQDRRQKKQGVEFIFWVFDFQNRILFVKNTACRR